mmetsp:Transcript_25875/g.51549  ORF Transcript_25875/g.51549 Transcript_25875/m.51549 type:complete len:281 (-) Transcript_25875:426-1268(-)
MSLGECISTKSCLRRNSRKSAPTWDWIRKMDWLAGVRRSIQRWLRRTSCPTRPPSAAAFSASASYAPTSASGASTRWASSIWKGRSGAARETHRTSVSWISTVDWVAAVMGRGASVTTPVASTTDSFGSTLRYAIISGGTAREGAATACTVRRPSRSSRNAILPTTRHAWTRARTTTTFPARPSVRSPTSVQTVSVRAALTTMAASPNGAAPPPASFLALAAAASSRAARLRALAASFSALAAAFAAALAAFLAAFSPVAAACCTGAFFFLGAAAAAGGT